MNYLLKEAIKRTSLKTLLAYAYLKDGVSLAQLNKCMEENNKQGIAIGKKQPEISDNQISFISEKLGIDKKILKKSATIEPVEYIVEQIREMRIRSGITVKEISGIIDVTVNQYNKYEQRKKQSRLEELIANILQQVEKKPEQNYWTHSLMYMTYNSQLSFKKAAEALGISPEKLWEYEWINQVPLNLVEKISAVYFVQQKEVPIKTSPNVPHCKTLHMIRINRGITLKEASKETGYSITSCFNWETKPDRVPPLDYVLYIIGNQNDSVEKQFLNANRSATKPVGINSQRIEYERKLNNKYCHNKKEFIMTIGISAKKYDAGEYTVRQAKKAAELLDIPNKKYDKLKEQLSENELKIFNMEIKTDRIKSLRNEKGLSIGKLAEAIEVPKGMICKMEKKQVPCSPILLKKIAEYFEKGMEYFV